jgi:hypothetical protein
MKCHSVGLDTAGGWNQLATPAVSQEGQSISAEELNEFMKEIRSARKVDSSVKLWRSAPTPKDTLEGAMRKLSRAWAPVQCENCHGPAYKHPFESGNYPKAVPTDRCTTCHTQERAPEWYNAQGELKLDVVEEKRKKVSCPAQSS